MKIKYITCALSVVLSFGVCQANLKYVQSDYLKFRKTGSCPNCDLTQISTFDVENNVYSPFDLSGADVSESFLGLYGNFSGSDFQKATGCRTKFSINGLKTATYSHSNFSNAILVEADFTNADLSFTDFNGANVRDADFTKANLYGSTGINFAEVKSVCDAIMPDGSKGKCS